MYVLWRDPYFLILFDAMEQRTNWQIAVIMASIYISVRTLVMFQSTAEVRCKIQLHHNSNMDWQNKKKFAGTNNTAVFHWSQSQLFGNSWTPSPRPSGYSNFGPCPLKFLTSTQLLMLHIISSRVLTVFRHYIWNITFFMHTYIMVVHFLHWYLYYYFKASK